MMKVCQEIQPREFIRAVLLVAFPIIGIVLPIDFASQVDGYLIYLRPWELLPVFGWAWLFYAAFGIIAGTGAGLIAVGVTKAFRKNFVLVSTGFGSWLALCITALSVVKAATIWLAGHELSHTVFLMSRYRLSVAIVTLLLVTIWHCLNPLWHSRLVSFAKIGTAVSLPVVLFAPIAVLLHRSPVNSGERALPRPKAEMQLPDIILITIDALTANHLSFYGYGNPTTPNLERLARKANVFERFYSNGNFTTPSTNSIINGIRPWTHRANQPLARIDASFAENGLTARLKRGGYQTFVVSTNPIAAPFHIQNDKWFDRIFDANDRESLPIIETMMAARYAHFLPISTLPVFTTCCSVMDHLLVLTRVWSPTDQHSTAAVLAAARHLIDNRNPHQPMFLWVHFLPPHSPYASPPPFLGRYDSSRERSSRFVSSPPWQFLAADDLAHLSPYIGRYDEAVAYVDDSLGCLLESLKGNALYHKALLIITADHGESFSHGYGGHGGVMLYDDLIHIPLIIKEPGQEEGVRVKTVAEQIDLMPTILDLAGMPLDGPFEGRSLKPALRAQAMDGSVFSMNFEQNSRFKTLTNGSVAMIEGRWKYVHFMGRIHYPMMPRLADSLYDLDADPGENINLVNERVDIAAPMLASIEEQLRRHGQALP